MKEFYKRNEIPEHLLRYFDEVPYPPSQCVVLDPFMGSGTTLLVATRLGRKSIGYDISENYCKMAMNRNKQGAL